MIKCIIMNNKIVAIIPARGGSKRLPGKNIYPICGMPMICWAIRAAKESEHISEVWVSTESEEIAKIARSCGAGVHNRSSKLSEDHVYKMDAIREAVGYLEDNDMEANIYVSLQANSPEITAKILDDALETFVANERNEILSVSPELMQNAAFRILKRGYAFQKDLSTKCGVFVCDLIDIHTLEDVELVVKRGKLK